MDNIQLAELAQRAANGDMSAFEEIYIELSPAVMSIAAEITHDDEDASDIMQDCFVAAIEKIGTLKNPEKLKSWLMRIATNKCYDYIKKKKPVILSEEKYELIDNIEENAIDFIPDSSYEHNERIEEVRKILDSLSEDKRLCLLMHYKYDMNYAEIADELGITVGAVKSKIFRAKNDIEKEAEKRKKKGMPLFGVAPFGLAVTALIKSADTSAAAFAGSAAQSAAFSGISVAAASSAAAATVAGAGAAGASAASGAVTAGTSIGAKIAALSVAQKVIAGVSAAAVITGSGVGIATVAKTNSDKEYETTVCLEETSAAFDYLPADTSFVEISENTTIEEASTSTSAESSQTIRDVVTAKSTSAASSASSANAVTSEKKTKSTSKATEKSTTTRKETTVSSATSTTTKPTTTATTTKKETTTRRKTTTTEEETTTKATTTKKETTTKPVTTTAKPTTTLAQTTDSRAVVTVTVWSSEASSTKVLYFNAGEKITATEIENRLSDEYGIEAIADDVNITAEAGGSYSATAYE